MRRARRRRMVVGAAVVGHAAAKSGASQQAAADQAAAQSAAPAPAAALAEADVNTQIQQLAQMHNAGVLTDAEFAAAKAKILGT
ncbi:MAG: SHOCT domain-containing protein, partial [Anaerolineales bacterium]|nr:SHOCT domain-containing protein [Anaerolineales bacterium]